MSPRKAIAMPRPRRSARLKGRNGPSLEQSAALDPADILTVDASPKSRKRVATDDLKTEDEDAAGRERGTGRIAEEREEERQRVITHLRTSIAILETQIAAAAVAAASTQSPHSTSTPTSASTSTITPTPSTDIKTTKSPTRRARVRDFERYNDLRDVGMRLFGLLAENRGCLVREVFEEMRMEWGD
ncbi:MAG: hypothetical protein M1817_006476 [Caeruleum heppii]|nr:MAG: hypothetical protein M1817_006476 [Caeruleum heppii]